MAFWNNRFESAYSEFEISAVNAFGSNWKTKFQDGKNLPEIFCNCVEEMISAMKRAKKISDIVIAKRKMTEKQQELKELENKLKDLESSDPRNTESA